MTDPIVKQALLDLVDVMSKLTTLVNDIDQRLTKIERHQSSTSYQRGFVDRPASPSYDPTRILG